MAEQQFIQGQRWISNTETDLGLGLVVEINNRRVTLNFPAAEEERTYAVDNAPLSRVQYAPGEQITNNEGLTIRITERDEINGCFFYHGINEQGESMTLTEMELDSRARLSQPQDRLFAGQIDKLSRYQLRYDTQNFRHQHQASEAFGLIGPRVQLLPHQFFIANSVGKRHAPRVLLADEVGLGKTIEAGLILHQQLISGRAKRALVVVPDALVYQWLVEMLRRFNLKFTILDGLRCTALEMASDENPFESAQLVLCSMSFLANDAERHALALQAQWDMMIVDEAHHLGWSEEAPSHAYKAIEALAEQTAGLLLLTATPEQLGVESHFARLRLLDPQRYSDLEAFRAESSEYHQVSHLVEQLHAEDLSTALQEQPKLLEQLEHYLGKEATAPLRQQGEITEDLITDLVSQLLDRHGTGRVLFRNTRDSVQGFKSRQMHSYPLEAPQAYLDASVAAGTEQQLHPETLLGEDWVEQDPRVEWLVNWLLENRDERALVICSKAETVKTLEQHMRLFEGARSVVFHEGMTLLERDRAAAYFADSEDPAQVMICSEIGSEGRNFQFARHLIMFDLPLNPDLLEQRIGRLDRIGQQHDVQIHLPHYANTAQAALLRWYHEGLQAFERVFPAGQQMFQQFALPLQEALQSGDEAQLDQLIADSRQAADEVLAQMQQGRDRLLERNSCQPHKAAAITEEVAERTNAQALAAYMERVCDQFGVDHQEEGEHGVLLHPGNHMSDAFPELPEEGFSATFDRTEALSREDLNFLTWEHPMLEGVMEMIAGTEFGNTAFCTFSLPPLQPGTLLLETVFRLNCAAPKGLQVQRFLDGECIRIVRDSNGNDLSKILTFDSLNKLAERVKLRQAQNLVRHTREQIEPLIEASRAQLDGVQEELVEAARERADHFYSQEIGRLEALAQVNGNVRPEELEELRNRHARVLQALDHAVLDLDALRVCVAT